MRGLMTDPAVAKSISGLGAYVDEGAFQGLFAEAGVPFKGSTKK